jgi:hypothetical protein
VPWHFLTVIFVVALIVTESGSYLPNVTCAGIMERRLGPYALVTEMALLSVSGAARPRCICIDIPSSDVLRRGPP